jgi:hypothetical protein
MLAVRAEWMNGRVGCRARKSASQINPATSLSLHYPVGIRNLVAAARVAHAPG